MGLLNTGKIYSKVLYGTRTIEIDGEQTQSHHERHNLGSEASGRLVVDQGRVLEGRLG